VDSLSLAFPSAYLAEYPYYLNMLEEHKTKHATFDEDEIHIDHVLSCQVFNAFLFGANLEYSFDRYYAVLTWLNKCWNFVAVPSKVNGMKSAVEIKVIQQLNLYWHNGKLDRKADRAILAPYFQFVTTNLLSRAKKDFLAAVPAYRPVFVSFLSLLCPVEGLEAMSATYACEPGCFCLKKNQSRFARLMTFHLFTTIKFPDACLFKSWDAVLASKIETNKKQTKKERTRKLLAKKKSQNAEAARQAEGKASESESTNEDSEED